MAKKEKYQKELDLVLEKIKFWRYVIILVISGVIGILFGLSQGKVISNFTLLIFVIMGFITVLFSVKRIESLLIDYQNKLDLLEKEE